MDWYYYIAVVLILSQITFLVMMYRNYHYALSRYKEKRSSYRPRTALFVPCKGIDRDFRKNVTSFFNQDYENFLLWFVVADKQDPAYTELTKLKNQLGGSSKALDVQILVAGQGQSCSQKIHNLLYCYERIGDDVEVLTFADSDVSVRTDWLSHLVYPLQRPKNGATSGYRWFIPKKNNPATLVLSAVNAKVAQLFGDSAYNQAWGGSMAIRRDVFNELGLDKIWPKVLSDDLSLSYAVKKAGKRVTFVPACLAASHEETNWIKLFEFGRRQFLITRVSAPKTWWFALVSSLYSILGLWVSAAIVVYAAIVGEKNLGLFAAVPILFFASQFGRALLRQIMISKLLKKDWPKMRAACVTDILFFWIWSPLLFLFIISSAFGRTIRWRGIRYKLLGPTETVVLSK
jgi:cellulose synthase/poly-beta-1,6-N-acetylglucosamine synthase-like glycosyltransferase